ncbi:OmpH family outer membrane protein [Oceanomicrobium pacificus]|uniref:OmpH family outer membrane protein n=1 Tax=Oceanomicrobium pacificus TaxID=2692916 RepID=A0A6B0TSS9_9RHOB|nr:OmpH family outer membrane protein [Oceanomicrobium pacificus]MXU65829.1 OmpH family outer membrane protein [Oceanomicrobium pacificus]
MPSNPAILVINQDRLLTDSVIGREILRLQEEEADSLRAESRNLEREFEREEQRLTDLRDTVTKDEFRALADAFDRKVVAAREAQEGKADALLEKYDGLRRNFLVRTAPVLQAVMVERGALAIMEQSALILSDRRLNVTQEVIERLDLAFTDISDITDP